LQIYLRTPLSYIGMLGVVFALSSPALLADASSDSKQLVRQLGSSSFAARALAEQEILGLGYESYSAIVEAAHGDDPEIRYRAERLLKILLRSAFADQQHLIRENPWIVPEAFAPGWEAFHQLLGDGIDSRKLYVHILNSETDLMLSLTRPGWQLQFERRCADMQVFSQQQGSAELQPGAIAAFLFLAAHPENQPSGSASAVIHMLIRDSNFQNAAELSSSSGVLKTLIGAWLRKGNNSSPRQRLETAVAFEIDAAMDVARDAIKDRNTRQANSIHIANSIFYLAKYGGQSVIEELEALLNDRQPLQRNSRYSTSNTQSPILTANVQIRDLALVALLHVTGQKPRTYDYKNLRSQKGSLYSGNSAKPASVISRDNALRKWRQWRANNVREPVPNFLNASEGELL
jgi:hypothetical protein